MLTHPSEHHSVDHSLHNVTIIDLEKQFNSFFCEESREETKSIDSHTNALARSSRDEIYSPMNNLASTEQDSPKDLTPSTSDESGSSPDNMNSVDIEAGSAIALHPLYPDLTNRFVNHHGLLLMHELPHAFKENLEFYTIITAHGLYQWNSEIQIYQCIMSEEQLKQIEWLVPHLEHASYVTAIEGEPLHDRISLDMLNQLNKAVLWHDGHTLIGYDKNPEIYLYLLGGMMGYKFPPTPMDWNRRVLDSLNKPLMNDINLSLREMAQSFTVFMLSMSACSTYLNKSEITTYDELTNNSLWILIALSLYFTLNMTLLRSGFFDRSLVESKMTRFQAMKEYTLRFAGAWIIFGQLICPINVAEILFFPVLLAGFLTGSFIEKKEWINIHTASYLMLLKHSLFFGLGVSGLFDFGLSSFISDVFVVENKNLDDPVTSEKVYNYLSIGQYCVLSFSIVSFFLQHPHLSPYIRVPAIYTSNILNGLGLALLDNNVLFRAFCALFMVAIGGNTFTPQETSKVSSYFGFQLAIFLYALMTSYPQSKDLTRLSMQNLPLTDTKRKFPCYNLFRQKKHNKSDSLHNIEDQSMSSPVQNHLKPDHNSHSWWNGIKHPKITGCLTSSLLNNSLYASTSRRSEIQMHTHNDSPAVL